MKTIQKVIFISLISIFTSEIFSQESLKSFQEDYYDFLSLFGKTERPYLNFRNLSDNDWNYEIKTDNSSASYIQEDGSEHFVNNEKNKNELWDDFNLGTKNLIKGNKNLSYRIYGPRWYSSFNSTDPYGQNDGALWQGKGYNADLTSGFRLECYGFEITVKPEICFSQNLDFEYIKPRYSSDFTGVIQPLGDQANYEGKASVYGYYGLAYIDAPQRFGDKAFFTFDFGESEIRYSFKNLTLGFGNQNIWLGPAKLNPIIHSNNAAGYPKVDIGLRRTSIFMPHFGFHLGDVEWRSWWGKTTESEYFDNDDTNDHNLFAGLSLAYSFPGIFSGLTVGFNRIMLTKWNNFGTYGLFQIYNKDFDGGDDSADQRFSLTFDYLLPKAGIDIYLEWGRNDFSPNMDYIIRYPFHTEGWTFGTEKAFNLKNGHGLKLLLEITDLECSMDYDRLINWSSTWYSHGDITQGHTNKGQWLGAGIGTGGNSQYLGAQYYWNHGSFTLFVQRRNPDLDYTKYMDAKEDYNSIYQNMNFHAEANIRCNLDLGTGFNYFLTKNTNLSGNYVFEIERNPLNKAEEGKDSIIRYNNHIDLAIEYNF